MSADRNLVFGLLALRTGVVTRDQLLDAMNDWARSRDEPLSAILCRRGVLAEPLRAALDAVAEQHARHHGDELSSVRALGGEPDWWLHDDGHAGVVTTAVSDKVSGVPPAGPPPGSAARFRRLRPHAKGGLGEVFVALDDELNREVALKQIKQPFADEPVSRARFVREAEITGHLEHPGVVPIYGLGADSDGRPFYAMRFLKGDSMQKAIARFHAADGPGRLAGERSLALRDLLARFVAVCDAVSFAHSMGVVHRDLKPANVMLGDFGETLVVDWGLARRLDHADAGEAGAAWGGSASGSTATEQGQVVGTPAYMPPEQAEGQLDRIGPSSDVFSLGATLYCLLTGQPPYSGEDIVGQARKGDATPARRRKPDVPRALEAVCVRAMAAAREARYGSARDLAGDVRHWLADEPVSAYREPAVDRLRRWGRRHRVAATAAVVLLAVSAVGSGLGLLAVERERRATAQQRDRAVTAEATANENLALARGAIDECYNVCRDHPLFQEPRMEKARSLLLERTLWFYENFRSQRPDDVLLRGEQADQWQRVAYIEESLSRLDKARAAYEKACALYAEGADSVEVLGFPLGLATAQNGLATVLRKQGDLKGALAEHEKARALLEQLHLKLPDNGDVLDRLTGVTSNLGNIRRDLGQFDESLADLRRAQKLRERARKGQPTTARDRRYLAGSHLNIGAALRDAGKRSEALAELTQARTIGVELLQESPDEDEYLVLQGRIHHTLGDLLLDLGRRPAALVEIRDAERVRAKAAAAFPDLPDYQERLADTRQRLGLLLLEEGQREEGLEKMRLAKEALRRLADAHPRLPRYLESLAILHNNLATRETRFGERDKALADVGQARAIYATLAAKFPDAPRYMLGHGTALDNEGNLLAEVNRHDESVKVHFAARDLLRKLDETWPSVPAYQNALARARYNLSNQLHKSKRPQEAKAELRESVAVYAQLVASQPDVPQYKNVLGMARNQMAILLMDQGSYDESHKEFRESLRLRGELAAKFPGQLEYQLELGGSHVNVCIMLRLAGKLDDSLASADRAVPLLRDALQKRPGSLSGRDFLRNAYRARAQTLVQMGRLREAVADWEGLIGLETVPKTANTVRRSIAYSRSRVGDSENAIALAEPLGRGKALPGVNLNDLARLYATCTSLAARDAGRPLATRESLVDRYGREAVSLLRRAAAVGYFRDAANRAAFDKDDWLASLRGRADYREFVESLAE